MNCYVITAFFALCIGLAWWSKYDNTDVFFLPQTCVNEEWTPTYGLRGTEAWNYRNGEEINVINVDKDAGDDAACIASSNPHTFKSITTCASIDAALSIARDFPHVTWYIYIHWGIYISNDTVKLPCNVHLNSGSINAFMWITNGGLRLAPTLDLGNKGGYCAVSFTKMQWVARNVTLFNIQGSTDGIALQFQDPVEERASIFDMTLNNVTISEGNITIRNTNEQYRLRWRQVYATDTSLTTENVQEISFYYNTFSNCILQITAPRKIDIGGVFFSESALYIHNNVFFLSINAYLSFFEMTRVLIDNCFCTHLVTTDTAMMEVMDPTCIKSMVVDYTNNIEF